MIIINFALNVVFIAGINAFICYCASLRICHKSNQKISRYSNINIVHIYGVFYDTEIPCRTFNEVINSEIPHCYICKLKQHFVDMSWIQSESFNSSN